MKIKECSFFYYNQIQQFEFLGKILSNIKNRKKKIRTRSNQNEVNLKVIRRFLINFILLDPKIPYKVPLQLGSTVCRCSELLKILEKLLVVNSVVQGTKLCRIFLPQIQLISVIISFYPLKPVKTLNKVRNFSPKDHNDYSSLSQVISEKNIDVGKEAVALLFVLVCEQTVLSYYSWLNINIGQQIFILGSRIYIGQQNVKIRTIGKKEEIRKN
eukprot:TRINITY_DN17142_c1_g1_i2.p2 TRINITY_DN17142_c1_g1~~TRINITY_DN17142_c1_g1_i2.p2  ORF type:complete len:214 (-),score=-3.50 TRINITY_DN17142_c1_g1_i2:51-692(-)